MALITLAFPIEEVRGKVGGDTGSVLYPVGGRMIMRDMTIPENPQTTLQADWRAILTQCAQAYGTTSEAQQGGWDVLGAAMAKSDLFGQDYALSGNQAFTAINSRRLADGQAIVLDAPAFSLRILDATDGTFVYDSGILRFELPAGTYAPGFIWARFSQVLPGTARKARQTDVATRSTTFAQAIVPIPLAGGPIEFPVPTIVPPPDVAGQRLGVYFEALDANYVPGQSFLSPSLALTEVP